VSLLAVGGCWYCTKVLGSADVLRLPKIPCIKHIRLKVNREWRKKWEAGRVGELYP